VPQHGPETENSSISLLADSVFDTGAVVLAAVGNVPGNGNVGAPANARKVLGIGAVDVKTFQPYADQSKGPTGDGRIKPDVVAPTNVETASNFQGPAGTGLDTYGGTSAATSMAGGAAAALRTFLRGGSADVDPGHVYAGMILSGSSPFPFHN